MSEEDFAALKDQVEGLKLALTKKEAEAQQTCVTKGIIEVKHILNDSFEFLSLTAPLSYYGIISAPNSLRRQSERTNAS